MLKSLTRLLRRPPKEAGTGAADEHAQIYKELVMTEELREALFPKTPQMVSAIFERPLPPLSRPPSAPASAPASDGESFPFIF